MDSVTASRGDRNLLDLPAEIRIAILEYVFNDNLEHGFKQSSAPGAGAIVDEEYSAIAHLQPLFTCRRMYEDGHIVALNHTSFVVSNLFFHIPERLVHRLHPKQVAAVRSITFVADARHFRKLLEWGAHPFGVAGLRLDTLTIALHRSSFWHYLFDFTADMVKLLRGLTGVRRLVFVRNGALVKGNFKTWYNRLVGLMMRIDHRERYDRSPPELEKVWWQWSYDDTAQSFRMDALPPKPRVDEETYMQMMLPLTEALKVSVENEEWNPDPRSRNGF